jgi:hypothetical protein
VAVQRRWMEKTRDQIAANPQLSLAIAVALSMDKVDQDVKAR